LIVCVTKHLFRIIDSLIYHHAGHSRDLVAADNTKAIVSITCQALAALFQVPVVVSALACSSNEVYPAAIRASAMC
jgi:hypothetical protein